MTARIFTGLMLAMALLAAGSAGAATIRVPIDQPTIAAGLAAAMPGDEVVLEPGVYHEYNLTIPCGVTLKGCTGNPACVIIDALSQGTVLAIMNTMMMVTVADLTLRGGLSPEGGGILAVAAMAVFQNCIIQACVATAYGGGVWATGAATMLQFIACQFIANVATVYDGGAIYATNQAAVYLISCVLMNNIAGRHGGALFLYWVTAELLRCTFFGNSALMGSCIGLYAVALPVIACILAYNLTGQAVLVQSRSTVEFSCTDIYGNPDGDWTDGFAGQLGSDGNICEDPQFCSTDGSGDNLQLQGDSPCADCDGEPMGAYDVGCGESAAFDRSWGALKLLY